MTACGEAYEALARGWGRGGRVQAAMKAAGNEGGCFVQLRYSIRLYGFGYDCTLTTCVLDLFTQQQKN